ncbi:phosphoadenosine phosphosulfate reductase family protein [Yersinia intermedia]|uniref:phosphoadenosine phosphosulfate reductase domain-containing protein n=1 Tax=Yersinia intermedia TaxID=631 RepID=UPI0022FDD522|nr:phosphoadenosine phosphosulfate reductase family protein [Yersinia intermedia]MDA5482162.1 phosphoadenosine phosphosulfate reductase family protein [Yersinia intermedia]
MKLSVEITQLIDAGAIFYVSHSGGKDSQAMYVLMSQHIPHDQIVVVHASLGEVEWPGIIEHITTNISHDLNIVSASKTFLGMVEQRGMWPSAKYRQCTSDLKRGPIEKFIRKDMKNRGGGIAVNCMGLRAEESAARSRRTSFKCKHGQTVKGRTVWEWLPVFDMSTAEVFKTITAAGQKPFWAYEFNDRLSCVFCIMGSLNDLQNGARHNPSLYRLYVELERRIGHTMFMKGKSPVWFDEYIGIPVLNIDEVNHG